jgi:hypothetical protein
MKVETTWGGPPAVTIDHAERKLCPTVSGSAQDAPDELDLDPDPSVHILTPILSGPVGQSEWPMAMVQENRLISSIDAIDFGSRLIWRKIAPEMLVALGADLTGLSVGRSPWPIRNELRRICLMSLHREALVLAHMKRRYDSALSPTVFMAWPASRLFGAIVRRIHLVALR